jgi:type I restriction enzyme S subunit
MRLTVDSEQLPVGWTKKKFSEIAILNRGHNPPKSQFIHKPQEGYVRFYQIRDGNNDDYEVYVPDTPHIHKVEPEDILRVAYRHIGRVFRGAKGAFNVALCKITNKDRSIIDDDYLFYIIPTEFVRGELMKQAERSLIPSMSVKHLAEIIIPVPPLPEQKRIVAILDEAFEGIDRAIANTEKNLANSRELFESYLNAIFTQKGDGWVDKRLGDIATFRNGLNFTKSSKGESIKIVGVKDFQNHFWIQEDQLDSVTIDADLKEIDILRKGDILTVRSNGNKELIGRCILADDISEKTSHSGFTIRIRIESEDIYPQFIVYSLKSRHIRKQLIESGGGISISSLNQQGLSLIKLSFPPFVEQKAIVANIDELAIEAQRLEAIYRKKLAALNDLKQSILQKAFTGELTADTPKTVKEEIAA